METVSTVGLPSRAFDAQWEALMSTYMLARLKLKYGVANLPRYDAAMIQIRAFFEAEGVMLEHALATSVGPLYEVWNLWRIDDHAHFARAVARLADPEIYARYAETLATMSEIVTEEDLSLLDTMPFFAAAPAKTGG